MNKYRECMIIAVGACAIIWASWFVAFVFELSVKETPGTIFCLLLSTVAVGVGAICAFDKWEREQIWRHHEQQD